MPDLFEIINKNSNASDLKRLISLRAFLLDEQDCPWVLLDEFNDKDKSIEFIINNSIDFFLAYNIKNISKLNLKPIDILLIPKNKRLKYLQLLDDIINSYDNYDNILIDKLRTDPFKEDTLLIKINQCNDLNSKYKVLLNKRNSDLTKLFSKAQFDITLNYNCSVFSKELKIKNYWKFLWANSDKYDEKTIIGNVIL